MELPDLHLMELPNEGFTRCEALIMVLLKVCSISDLYFSLGGTNKPKKKAGCFYLNRHPSQLQNGLSLNEFIYLILDRGHRERRTNLAVLRSRGR